MTSAVEDIKSIKTYVLGVVAFAGAIAGFCTTVFGWDLGKVTAVTAVAAVVFIALAFLIQRSEIRNMKRLDAHISDAENNVKKVSDSLDYLKEMALENQRATTRIEMNSFIRNEPWNHDTILAYAEKYFLSLGGDWKETDRFMQWVDDENEQGRKVRVPSNLLADVQAKITNENKGDK